MSLYNMMFGVNPLSGILLGVLGLDTKRVGRFRDSYLEKNDDGELEIHVYTRNGGGNREHWDHYNVDDEGNEDDIDDCQCPGCTIEKHLPQHPHYIRDFDDDFDCTYATIVFKVPPQFKDAIEDLASASPEDERPATRWDRLLGKLQSGDKNDPEVQNAMTAMAPTIEAIRKAFDAAQKEESNES